MNTADAPGPAKLPGDPEGELSRLDLLSEIGRLHTLERALRLHRSQEEARLRKIASLRERLEGRLKELEGG